jgi:hypothetical protein
VREGGAFPNGWHEAKAEDMYHPYQWSRASSKIKAKGLERDQEQEVHDH